eukprot:CAMPEP_0184350048 /NCGR_PEP_ID=MMETSP1089-20130417/37442_1 /TAXON_ID=38269 ORGANISM="Gloeochaete wittrockiana, Strain SAG46.84" /NCGR_SAMPLE_ID=MMETSP1089 /ASSEMBLY_ACC=CAM_ASM_000445 /LENGTH=86 /DNA_ID=CAMNT_0026682603 /DNA_START=8 /DNA_END=268 /DNA_ORIENTATION=+
MPPHALEASLMDLAEAGRLLALERKKFKKAQKKASKRKTDYTETKVLLPILFTAAGKMAAPYFVKEFLPRVLAWLDMEDVAKNLPA